MRVFCICIAVGSCSALVNGWLSSMRLVGVFMLICCGDLFGLFGVVRNLVSVVVVGICFLVFII